MRDVRGPSYPYEKSAYKNHTIIIQKLSTHTENMQKTYNFIQKIYNKCAKNCNNLSIEALQFLTHLLYVFCMELHVFCMFSVCVNNCCMISVRTFFIGLAQTKQRTLTNILSRSMMLSQELQANLKPILSERILNLNLRLYD